MSTFNDKSWKCKCWVINYYEEAVRTKLYYYQLCIISCVVYY